jgi:hypothetical protein
LNLCSRFIGAVNAVDNKLIVTSVAMRCMWWNILQNVCGNGKWRLYQCQLTLNKRKYILQLSDIWKDKNSILRGCQAFLKGVPEWCCQSWRLHSVVTDGVWLPLCPQQIPHWRSWDWIWTSVVRGWWLITWTVHDQPMAYHVLVGESAVQRTLKGLMILTVSWWFAASCIHASSGIHRTSSSVGNGGSLPSDKTAGVHSVEVKHGWISTSAAAVWLRGVHRDSSTILAAGCVPA